MIKKLKKDPLIFIEHILESIKNIEDFSKGLSKDSLVKNRLNQSAIIRELEIIGEAVMNISNDFREKYPGIEWSKIAATRNKIIHNYFGIDFNIIWDIIKEDAPRLKKDIQEILEKEKDKF